MMEKIDTPRKLGPYGDERRIDLFSRAAAWPADRIEMILGNPMRVLSCSYWNNFAPWRVPFRVLPDNFCLFVLSGTVQLKLEDAEYRLPRGHGFLLGVNVRHEFGLAPGESACRHLVFHALPGKPTPVNPINLLTSPCHPIPSLLNDEARLLDLIALTDSGRTAAERHCDGFLNGVLLDLAKAGNFAPPPRFSGNSPLCAAISCIERNYQANLSVADVAAAAGIHEVQCRKLFRRHLNVSPGEYLRNVRLDHAVKLLLGTSRPVKEVAWESGFSNSRYFCFVFKQCFHSTPADYRDQNRC